MKTTKLYRPVNKVELDLIQGSDWQKFPPRLPEQPIFYPVTNQEYASQITIEWNLPSYNNGFVTEFELESKYLSRFKVEKVGLDHHTELWVQAEELDEFNSEIIGGIKVVEGYHSNKDNAYVFIKEVFKVQDDWAIAFEFLNHNIAFELSESPYLGSNKLKKYLEIPRKIHSDGSLDLKTFIIKLSDSKEMAPFAARTVELLSNKNLEITKDKI